MSTPYWKTQSGFYFSVETPSIPFIYLYRIYCVFLVLMCSTFLMCSTYLCFYVFMLCVVLIVFLFFLCLLYAPSHQKKFQVGVNLLGNKSHSDSDSDLTAIHHVWTDTQYLSQTHAMSGLDAHHVYVRYTPQADTKQVRTRFWTICTIPEFMDSI